VFFDNRLRLDGSVPLVINNGTTGTRMMLRCCGTKESEKKVPHQDSMMQYRCRMKRLTAEMVIGTEVVFKQAKKTARYKYWVLDN